MEKTTEGIVNCAILFVIAAMMISLTEFLAGMNVLGVGFCLTAIITLVALFYANTKGDAQNED